MAAFTYKARTKAGELRDGIIEASSKDAAIETLQRNGLMVFEVAEEKPPSSFLEWKLPFGRVKQKDIVVLSRQLSTLFEAQIPVMQALKTLVGETANATLKDAIAEILDDVAGGLALSQALGKHPNIFSPFYINLIRSGEESGKLQDVFTYLADYLERSYYLSSKAKNALIYPAFVFCAFIGVVVVLLVVVIPRLTAIFEETGQAVPFYTQIVIFLSLFLRHWGFLLLVLLIAGALAAWRWAATERGIYFFHKLQITVPLFGDLYRKLFMARMTDNLRTLIVGGIPILRALSITGDVVGNVVYKKAINDAIEAVKGGGTISAAFEKTPEIPVLITQMVRIGEATGKLDFILGNIAKFYQREVDSMTENLVSLIEPALIIFLGVGVGLLVTAVLVPLYNLVGSI